MSWLKTSVDAAKAWNADNVFKHSAAVSFYTLFSLAPISIIVVTIIGIFFGKDKADHQFEEQIRQLVGPAGAEVVRAAAKASQIGETSRFATTVGVVLLLVGATTVFGQLQDSLNDIWCVKAKPTRRSWVVILIRRFVSFTMVLTIGFVLLVSLVISTAIESVQNMIKPGQAISPAVLQGTNFVLGLIVISLLFAVLLKFLPDVRLRWRDVWMGAVLTALLFSGGRYLIALYLGHSTVASIYGTAGSLVALLIWVYYSCAIFFYGVEFTRAYRTRCGLEVEPRSTAVRVSKQVVESANSSAINS